MRKMVKKYYLSSARGLLSYYRHKRDYHCFLDDTGEPYSAFGDFLNWGRDKDYASFPKDQEGMVTSVEDPKRYNPCTVAQYVLTTHGKYIRQRDESQKKVFFKYAENYLGMIEEDGSIRYYFDYPYYRLPDCPFKAGWTSGMDYGHALSVLARLASLSGSSDYSKYAEKMLNYLSVPIDEGG